MAVASYDDLISRVGSNYAATWPFYGELQSTTGLLGGNNQALQRLGYARTLPSYPSGVTGYIVTAVQGAISLSSVTRTILVCQCVNLGSLDISTNTFTDGSSMPTITELGSSVTSWGPVFVEYITALGGTPGSLTITYVDQDGNSAETSAAQAMSATNPNPGTVGWIVLNSGDVGVRDITTAARSGGTTPTGTVKFWGVLPICQISTTGLGAFYIEPMLTQDFMWANLPEGSDIRLFNYSGGTSIAATAMSGILNIIGDS
jgi:hypothetical protein